MTGNEYIERLLAKGESARVEFRSSVKPMDSIARTVCAFLNSAGGTVIVGVDEHGQPNQTATQDQSRKLRKFLGKEITPQALYDVEFDHTSAGEVISVGVPAGADRPYVFQGAVFLRKRGSTAAADAAELRAFVEGTSLPTARWERRISLGLEIEGVDRGLLQETVQRAQTRRGYSFDNPSDPAATLEQLGLLRAGQLTNAADALFGLKVAIRHPQTRLRAVRYATDRGDDFLDEQLYDGPAIRLLENGMAFLKRNLTISAEFHAGQLSRESKPQYPFHALREALVNALVHRDYAAFSGSVTVSVYPDRVEFWNTGKLPRGISPRDLLLASHSSILVNPDICHVFYFHELMERVGRGTYKIAQECRELGMRTPEWKNVGTGVRLTMYAAEPGSTVRSDLNQRQKDFLSAVKPGAEMQIGEYLQRFGRGISDRQARRDVADLEACGLLERYGAAAQTIYRRTDKQY